MKKAHQESLNITSSIYSFNDTQRHSERANRIFEDSELLKQWSKKFSKVNPELSQGNMFEQLEVTKFNLDAMKKDSELFAKTTASMGAPTDPVDIIISDGKKVVREIQAKSGKNAARTAFALSDEKYKEMARLGPKEQNEKIKELLDSRIDKGTLKAADYEQTRRNLQKSLRHDNVASEGTTYKEAIKATNSTEAEKIARQMKIDAALTDMHESGKVGGKIGALGSAGFSVLSGAVNLYKDDAKIGDVITDVVFNSAKGYAFGYTTTALSKGVTHTATEYLGKSVSSALTKSNAPVAIASGIVATAKSFGSYLVGNIDSDELIDQINHTVITSTSSFYYGALGQVAIPIPVVGAMIGAGVGYFIGSMLHQSAYLALGECEAVKQAKERRATLEAICQKAIPQMQKHRAELEAHIEQHFKSRKVVFIQSFDLLDEAISEWDPDKVISSLEAINNSFGATLQFKNFKEFDNFMLDEDSTFVF